MSSIRSDLLSHIQKKLHDADKSNPSHEKKRQNTLNTVSLNESNDSIVHNNKATRNQQKEEISLGLQGLLNYFEQKLLEPEYSDSLEAERKKKIYSIFEDSIYRSLRVTKLAENYDDFADIAVLYFISEADTQGFSVKEIENLIEEIS